MEPRLRRLDQWKSHGVDPFGQAFLDTLPSAQILSWEPRNQRVRLAGRIIAWRDMGKSVFAHLLDQSGKIQIYGNVQSLGEESYRLFKELELGDIVGIEGELFSTRTGEKTVRARSFRLLCKSLRPIPSLWYGLQDPELRSRHRYLDLIANPERREVFLLRSRLIRQLRRMLEDRGFIEVETPILHPVAGGATARPFVTHHTTLDLDLYLRIAPELYLKRLLVAGFEKIYELGRNFRNEGISRKHNPEFTMLEAYWAYADYRTMAKLVEELIVGLAQELLGKLQYSLRTLEDRLVEIDLTPPWEWKTYRQCIEEAAGSDWYLLSFEEQKKRALELGVETHGTTDPVDLSQKIFEKRVESQTYCPLFVSHLPAELVPLAKPNAQDPTVVDAFELIIGGMEIAPGYSELNDPLLQRKRMETRLEEGGTIDEDFLHALQYGMPPAGGIGIGIDRLVMVFSGVSSIREVIFFPTHRPKPFPL
ncbi:lysine--tRNA ligase [Candidatus Methylacidithermus pantelleriae]|nr:lysine--tRNA ligase [Candidatus Methylacidithermus pantelleriae]